MLSNVVFFFLSNLKYNFFLDFKSIEYVILNKINFVWGKYDIFYIV